MSYTKTQGKTLSRSDGSELIPAEVNANIRHDGNRSLDVPFAVGYTIDDEGLINSYAIQPDMSASEYPSPKQQQRYIFLGAGATLFVVTLLLIAFAVS
ncbi:MAG: ssl1498 family light-harvesting-like protein [Cyanobacteria bacterium CRU_2_1]|nr:ssl1498 family light-harvesting-like protein [Cyanobacteria bacterium RU_5_0]NJR59614.1 ssl1498 family light-harvesting-like protein [Cyanobacteria bacterium CRU_2_1]